MGAIGPCCYLQSPGMGDPGVTKLLKDGGIALTLIVDQNVFHSDSMPTPQLMTMNTVGVPEGTVADPGIANRIAAYI